MEANPLIPLLFRDLCPGCGGTVSASRLLKGLPCEKCLPSSTLDENILHVRESYKSIIELEKKVKLLDDLFVKIVGAPMWGLQRLWAKRFLEGESYVMVAPTGSGKTTAQIILSLYAAKELGKRSLILVPTSLLAHQVHNKLIEARNKLKWDIGIACYHSLLTEKQKRLELNAIKDSMILVTTSTSIIKRPEFARERINVAFVDDVDSFLRRSKSIDVVLKMLNITDDIIALVREAEKLEKEAKKLAKDNPEESKRLYAESRKLREEARSRVKAQVIVSGATQTARRTRRVRDLNAILGFTVGGRIEFSRRIIDTYLHPKSTVENEIVRLVKTLGDGGLIFIPLDKGIKYGKALCEKLIESGIRAEVYESSKRRLLERFINGEIDVLIGTVSYRSPLTRGIDLPERIRYALFAGVPKFKIRINVEEFSPTRWLILLNNILDVIPQNIARKVEYMVSRVSKLRWLRKDEIEKIREAIREGKTLTGYLEYAKHSVVDLIKELNEILQLDEVLEAIKNSPTLGFGETQGQYYFTIPDTASYIQASGRTSRLYVGGVTLGLSVVVIDDIKAFNSLKKETTIFYEDITWKEFNDIDLEKVLKEIDEDRRKVRLALEGKLKEKIGSLLKTTLLIVESPNKARTIARMFGRPTRKTIGKLQTYEVVAENRFLIVTATGGHILDLVKDEGLFGVNVKDGAFTPVYKPIRKCIRCGREVPEEEEACPYCGSKVFIEAKSTIEALRQLAKYVDEVLIGSDPDSEGEKIAWDTMLILKPYNRNIKRMRFHEVTKRGLKEALNNLSDIDLNLVYAQIVRRVEDRWIGFSLSPILWRVFGKHWLSAGRVQTPVLGWIVRRTRESREKAELIDMILENDLRLILKLPRGTYKKIKEKGAIEVISLKREQITINPPPPYTTDSLLMDANRFLGFSATKTMNLAQRLFEVGLITYHRTDSTTVSYVGLGIAKEYITSTYGQEYYTPRRWERPGAHECIRPTRPLDPRRLRTSITLGLIRLAAPLSDDALRLYGLIFRRFIASQMKPTVVERVTAKMKFGETEVELKFDTRIIEDGFSKIVPVRIIPEASALREGSIGIKDISYRLVPAKPLYSYSDVINLMKERGIGRPSTYAKIIDTLRRRGYIIEVARGKLVATKRGIEVYSYLVCNFNHLVNEERTRILESVMDDIEKGAHDPYLALKEFYSEIMGIVEKAVKAGIEYPTLKLKL